MRITGGRYGGRRVEVPDGVIRPSMDRMRESVFAILGDLSGRSFLDLFTGSGVIALEAASRGADPIEAVEKDPLKRGTLLKNVSLSETRIQCHFMPVELYLRRAKRSFDILFLDPPFPYPRKIELLAAAAASRAVAKGTSVLMHRPREDRIADSVGSLVLQDRREYGRSIVDFFLAVEVPEVPEETPV